MYQRLQGSISTASAHLEHIQKSRRSHYIKRHGVHLHDAVQYRWDNNVVNCYLFLSIWSSCINNCRKFLLRPNIWWIRDSWFWLTSLKLSFHLNVNVTLFTIYNSPFIFLPLRRNSTFNFEGNGRTRPAHNCIQMHLVPFPLTTTTARCVNATAVSRCHALILISHN
jgi:hypothetical protein